MLRTAIRAVLVVAVAVPATAGSARADSLPSSGGTSAPTRPEIQRLACETGAGPECPRGAVLEIRGENLATARTVVFLGGRGPADDRRARAAEASPHELSVRIPAAARSGPVRVASFVAGRSRATRALKILAGSPTPPPSAASPGPSTGAFPVRGQYSFGTFTNAFGGGRGHKGQDVLADCGTPLVAALPGEVIWNEWHAAAGNYVVITADDGTSQAYMHMKSRSPLRRGQRVSAGDPVGEVGTTGRSSACHLHLELWTAPGWYSGGQPIDPLPLLKRLSSSAR